MLPQPAAPSGDTCCNRRARKDWRPLCCSAASSGGKPEATTCSTVSCPVPGISWSARARARSDRSVRSLATSRWRKTTDCLLRPKTALSNLLGRKRVRERGTQIEMLTVKDAVLRKQSVQSKDSAHDRFRRDRVARPCRRGHRIGPLFCANPASDAFAGTIEAADPRELVLKWSAFLATAERGTYFATYRGSFARTQQRRRVAA